MAICVTLALMLGSASAFATLRPSPPPSGCPTAPPSSPPSSECIRSDAYNEAWNSGLEDLVARIDADYNDFFWMCDIWLCPAQVDPCKLKAHFDRMDAHYIEFKAKYAHLLDGQDILGPERTHLVQVRDFLLGGEMWLYQRLADPRTPIGLRLHGNVWGLEEVFGLDTPPDEPHVFETDEDVEYMYDITRKLGVFAVDLKTMWQTTVEYGYTYAKNVCDQVDKPLSTMADDFWPGFEWYILGATCKHNSTKCDEYQEVVAPLVNESKALWYEALEYWGDVYLSACQHEAYALKDLPATAPGFELKDPVADPPMCLDESTGEMTPLFTKACELLGDGCIDPATGIDYSPEGLLTLSYQTAILDSTKSLDDIYDAYDARFEEGLAITNNLFDQLLASDYPSIFNSSEEAIAGMSIDQKSNWFRYKVTHVQANFLGGDLRSFQNYSEVDELGVPAWQDGFADDVGVDGTFLSTSECYELPYIEFRAKCPKRYAYLERFEGMINLAENILYENIRKIYHGRGPERSLTACRFVWRVTVNRGFDTPYMSGGSDGSPTLCPEDFHSGMYTKAEGSFYNDDWSTIYHEGIIGHGYQIPAEQEIAYRADDNVCSYSFGPYYRGGGSIIEGYAVYAESVIGNEMGVYEPPYQIAEIFKAEEARLSKVLGAICVVDICLARGTCTWDEAVDTMVKSEYGTSGAATRVVRSATTTGQSCTYDAGFLFFRDLHKYYQEQISTLLGEEFVGEDTLRPDYEYQLQKAGSVPFDVTAAELAKWWKEVLMNRNMTVEEEDGSVPPTSPTVVFAPRHEPKKTKRRVTRRGAK